MNKKEKAERQLIVKMQPSLYEAFEKKCQEQHRTVSELVRELVSKYSDGYIQMPEPILKKMFMG